MTTRLVRKHTFSPCSHLHVSPISAVWATRLGFLTLACLAPVARAQRPLASDASAHAADSLLAVLLPSSLRIAVLANAPELTAWRSELKAADARRDALGFAPPATATVETEDARNGRPSQSSARLVVGWELLTGTRRRSERAVGDAAVVESRLLFEGTRRRVLANTVRALYAGSGWRLIVDRLAAQDEILADAETSVQARFATGDARYVDVLRVRTERLRVQGTRATAEAEIDAGETALAALLGGDSAAVRAALAALDRTARNATAGTDLLTDASRLPEAPAVETLTAVALPVLLAEARGARLRAERLLLVARQRPAPTVAFGLQRIGPDAERAPGVGPVLSAGVTLPFTARNANRAALVAADRTIASAGASGAATRVAVHASLAIAQARYAAARRRALAFDAALLRGAREERENALAAYRSGQLSLVEFLDFERALAEAENSRIRTSLEALDALAALLAGPALGRADDAAATTPADVTDRGGSDA